MAAFYINSISNFLNEDSERIIGILTHKSGLAGFHQQLHKQTISWSDEIEILKDSLYSLVEKLPNSSKWSILLEYPIARREKRIDIVIIADDIIIVIEFKGGQSTFESSHKEQLIDYCLDLRDFHFESRNKIIVPILLAIDTSSIANDISLTYDGVQPILYANKQSLCDTLFQISTFRQSRNGIDASVWNESIYSPTPTIIEAAQTLFSGKSVEEISRSHAGTKNLTKTSNAVIDAINQARTNKEKIICFITGVPGAGKTLAGLNIAHHNEFQNEESLATFLSGNGPLIKVLREALTRDAYKRLKAKDSSVKKKEQERIIAFIENVHRFIDTYFFNTEMTPNNKIVIFDEAQRAWNAEHSKRKFNRDFSEPEMMFEIMNRHQDWAVIIALIGGGQEINTGEAGLREWGNNILRKYKNWKVYISPELKSGDHSTGNMTLFDDIPEDLEIIEDKDLHLNVAIRSYKAEELSNWVNLVLINESSRAQEVFTENLNDYEIVVTRNLHKAKDWLRSKCQGTRRMGLVASSGGRRLRAHGLDVKAELEEANWFLNDRDDVRSSYYLELPATEFGIQGLELDWVGVCWDGDLRRNETHWDYKSFKGTTWHNVKDEEKRKYIINKYRVLLTRAREGMVIWIPEGDKSDKTRLSEFYNPIFEYLKSCGIPEL